MVVAFPSVSLTQVFFTVSHLIILSYATEVCIFFFAVAPVINNVKGTFEITDIRDLISITTGAVVTIPRGVSVKIQCIAKGVPFPKITWYKKTEESNHRVLVRSGSTDKILDDHSISISHAELADAAEYICVAANIAGRDEGTTLLNIGSK